MTIVYSPNYNMGLLGLERFHPFDVRKFERAWRLLESRFGASLNEWHVDVDRPASDVELLAVHTQEHLSRLRDPAILAKAFEVPAAELVPFTLLDRGFLAPMRWAVRGSVIAAEQALHHGIAINLGGGFHHAKPDRAEGFCLFSDIALMVAQLRASGKLMNQRIAYIDLDAHQGNGVCHQFLHDSQFFIFDMYNDSIYPTNDRVALGRIDCSVPLPFGCEGPEYLDLLRTRLPGFLDSITRSVQVGLAIYTAGTDVFGGDDVGFLGLSAEHVLTRDVFVINELRRRKIPAVMLLGGGYTTESHRLVATSVAAILEQHGQRAE